MIVKVVCLLVCLSVTVQSTNVRQSADTVLSRHKRGSIEDIFNGLINTFSKTVDEVLDLEDGDFEKVVKGVKNIGGAVAKKIFGFFQDFTQENQDIGGQRAIRVDQLMEALREDITEREEESVDGNSGAAIATISNVVATFFAVIAAYFTR